MASTPPTAELSDVRKLAQKLFAQCQDRDAPSSYKLLSKSVRTLRNGLEEVEEDYDSTRTLGPDDMRLLGQISRSHDILSRLDLALQSYRCSAKKDVNMNAVSDLKTALDVTTHQLKLAFDATTTGEIPIKIDTGTYPGQPHPSASVEDSSASRSRKSSVWSMTNPRSPGASDATSVHNDRVDRYPGEEKQVLSPSASSASEARASMDWRSPFADPLSMGIEAATSFILGGDDDLSMSAYARPISRARAESNTSAATETFFSAPGSPDTERKPSTPNIDAVSANEPRDLSGETIDSPVQPSESEHISESVVEQLEHHLSPETATRELALKKTRTNSNASLKEDTTVDEGNLPSIDSEESIASDSTANRATTPPDSSHRTVSESEPASDIPSPSEAQPLLAAALPAASDSASQSESPAHLGPYENPSGSSSADWTESSADDFAKDLSNTMEAAFAEEQRPSTSKPLPPSPPAGTPPSETAEQEEPASPPPPTRRPPPPPPAIRRSKPKAKTKLRPAQSKYRIVNDAPSDSSSDDELYSSSRPNSPPKAKIPPSMQSPPLATPTIQIDQSALDEVEEPPVEATASPAAQDDKIKEEAPDVGPQLPQTVYKPPSSAKPPIFARKSSSNSISQQITGPVKEDANLPKSSPGLGSPKSSKKSQRPQSPQSPPLPPSVQKRVDAAAKAGDQLRAREIETRFQREGKPPPVPPRPQSRHHRPRAATTISSPAVLSEKEPAMAESGLELSEEVLAPKPTGRRLVSRVSVDHALNVNNRDSTLAPEPTPSPDGTRHSRSASTSQLPPPQFSPRSSQPSSSPGHRLTGWYGPGADETPQYELDNERIEHIAHFWNNMAWDRAEEYLMAYLESLIEQDNLAVARRVRHLLAVCATFKGDIERAVTLFLSILEISEPADLNKPGNCEACYWLGDLYALQNLRLEALLAYCAAQWGELFKDPEEPHLGDLIKAEQEAVQLGSPKSDFKVGWSQEAKEGCGTILDPKILPAAVVKHLFEVEPRREPRNTLVNVDRIFQLDPNKPRSSGFFQLSSSPQISKFRRNMISAQNFLPNGPWPLQYDPTFTMANVKRERLLGFECDLLSVLQSTNGDAKIPKTGPMSLSRMDCFTCNDLPWLITAVRDCLNLLGMDWSEVANEQGVWFVVRHSLMDGPSKSPTSKMATVHYFAISLFRQSFRSSYGVEICSHGVSSARIMEPSNLSYEKGVHLEEGKRIKKLIKETLEEADKRRPAKLFKKRQSSIGLGISSRSSSDDQPVKVSDEFDAAPAIPPRPKKPSS